MSKVDIKILNLFCILLIVITTIVFYWNGMQTYFAGSVLWELSYSESHRHDFFSLAGMLHVRPITYALLDTLYRLFGLNPLPYHIVVLSIHIINSILVFFIAKKLADNRLIGFITAMLFATFWAHPEPVVSKLSAYEMFLASFILSTLVSFYTYRQNPTKLNYFLVLLFAILAMGSKESSPIILVPLIYLTDRYIAIESPGLSRTKLSKTPYIPLILLSLGLLAYLRFGPIYDAHVRDVAHYDKVFSHFVTWISYTFSFPLLSNASKCGNINLIMLALFYLFSPAQIRDRLSLLMAANALLAIPTAPLGSPGLRYIYFASFFSMTMVALMLYHGTTRLVGIIKVKEDFGKVLVIFLCATLIYYNYSYTNKLIEYYNKSGKVAKNLLRTVLSDFPNGTLNTHLIFVNLPAELKDEHSSYPEHEICAGYPLLMCYYGKNKVGQVSLVNVLEIHDGKYRLNEVKNITSLEFESLTKEKGNKVYFFNSKDLSFQDVTGKDYSFLTELINRISPEHVSK